MRESFIFYKSFFEAINEVDLETQAQIYNAIFEYQFNDNLVELNGIAKALFSLIKPQLDANNTRYENGKKGGRPKQKEKTKTKPKQNQNKTKVKPNDNVNDNENVNVNVNANENVNVNVNANENVNHNHTHIVEEWNKIGLSEVRLLSKSRKEKLQTRINEYGKELIIKAIGEIPKSKFLMGDNDNGWKCTFDWLIENDKNLLKVLEGNYETKEKGSKFLESLKNDMEVSK